MLRTLFFGTPEFAVPTLLAMAEAGYRPSMVVTQPARRAGRGRHLQEPPVALAAHRLDIPVLQPRKVADPEAMAALEEQAPDLAVVVAYGQIFRRPLLELPRLGCVNVHASLLPSYRGAAPIQAAIAAGDTVTGITTMQMEEGLDSGPMWLQEEVPIAPRQTAGELAPILAEVGAGLLVRTLAAIEEGSLQSWPQDDAKATYAPRIKKEDGRVQWQMSAVELDRRLRAFTPWPGLTSELGGKDLKLLAGRPREENTEEPPGTLLGLCDSGLSVACGGGTIFWIGSVQRPGKRPLAAADFYHGERLRPGQRFVSPA